jgi:lipid-A-disaccharide synthase
MPNKRIMIIAGEASGDMHGAKLAEAIKRRDRRALLFGVGGRAMQSAGVDRILDAQTLSVVGITEVFAKLKVIYRGFVAVKRALKRLKPDLLILIDFPDFNLLVASVARKLKIPVLYYISPQIWAWRQRRVKKIRRLVDHMAVIFPFEAQFYRRHRVPVTFVGHPLLDRIPPFRLEDCLSKSQLANPVIGLVPGSREKEVTALLPAMLEAAVRIKNAIPSARFLVSSADTIHTDVVESILSPFKSSIDIEIVSSSVERLFRSSQLLVAASGTVTLEAALHGVPAVIVYKVSPISYWLGKRLIKVKHIGIVNLISQKELMPELIQDDASPENIAAAVTDLARDWNRRKRIVTELMGIRARLGGAGASDRVASIAMRLV